MKLKWGNCIGVTEYAQYPEINMPSQSDDSGYDPEKDDYVEDVNMCDGICGNMNSHGCWCDSGCAERGDCCAEFNYDSMCNGGDSEEDT